MGREGTFFLQSTRCDVAVADGLISLVKSPTIVAAFVEGQTAYEPDTK